MRIISALLTVAIISSGGAALYLMSGSKDMPQPELNLETEFLVRTVEARPGGHSPRLSSIGTVEARTEADIYSPLESEVLELSLEEGGRIGKGQPMLTLDTRETRFQLDAQQAAQDEIDAQIAALEGDRLIERLRMEELQRLALIAKEERNRTKMLHDRGVVSKSALQQVRTALGQRELELLGQRQKIDALELSAKRLDAARRSVRSQIGQLRLVLERARMLAPFDGVVKSVLSNAGQRVQRGALLAQIYDPSTLRLRAPIPGSQAARQGAGIRGQLLGNTTGPMLELLGMAPVARKGTGSVDALFALPGDDWLLGAAIEIDLILPLVEESFALPFDALYSGTRIYRVDAHNRADPVDCVSLGMTSKNGNTVALLKCPKLAAGDRVVTSRIPSLITGSKLRSAENGGN